MIFSCTKKVINKLKKVRDFENSKEDIGLHNWYLNFINLERKNHILFTNSKTLFSFFIYAGTKKEHNQIEILFEEKLSELIIREFSSSSEVLEKLLPKDRNYHFTKTNSRSILGSMNELAYQIDVQLWHRGSLSRSYDVINHSINKIPMSIKGLKGYQRPSDKMKEELGL